MFYSVSDLSEPSERLLKDIAATPSIAPTARTIERRIQAAASRADKLPQAILAKAFSGELVPTEAELARAGGRGYETAEQLLARVTSAPSPEPTAKRAKPGRRRTP
jgi:type I restriction enzyme, S subunit